jgi:hypothetical protein
MAYVTTETGVATMIIMALVAAYLLTVASSPKPSRRPAADHQIARCRNSSSRPALDPLLHAGPLPTEGE